MWQKHIEKVTLPFAMETLNDCGFPCTQIQTQEVQTVMDDVRWCSREPIEIHVDLAHGKHKIGQCRTRNISLGGMFIVLPDAEVPVGATLDVCVEDPANGYVPRVLKASVVHRQPDGLGIMYRDFSIQDLRLLQSIFRHAGRNPTGPDAGTRP